MGHTFGMKEREMMSNSAMAAAIRAKRAVRGITIADLADKAGISSRTLDRYMAGEGAMDFATLTMIATGLDTTVVELAQEATVLLESDPQFSVSAD